MAALYAGIEAGGTKFNLVIGSGPEDIRAEARIATRRPPETLGEVTAFLDAWHAGGGEPLAAIGIASFGPVDLKPGSARWGFITDTPKPHWQNTDIGGSIRRRYGVPVGFDTDVNGAGLGELRWGAGAGCDVFVYLTIGTGIGGGLFVHGEPVHGLVHTEMGHMRLPHDRARDPYDGCCPFHGDCLQGLASGLAMSQRWGTPADGLPEDHPGWDLEAGYLALACANLALTCSPERIILGGGVMDQTHLFPRVRTKVLALLNGYIHASRILEQCEEYITPAQLGSRAGALGALCLAARAAAARG